MDQTHRTRLLRAVLQCLNAAQWRQAETHGRALLAQGPDDLEAALLLGLAIAAAGEPARAAPILDRVARSRPDHAHPCRDLASLRPALPRALVASQYRACLRLAPADARLRRDFADFLLDGGAADEALMVLRDALGTAAAHHLAGLANAELGRFQEAIDHFREAVRLDPIPSMGWSNLGMMLKIERRFDAALAAHDAAVARSPADPRIRVNRAVALLQAGRWTEAWAEYEWRLQLPGRTVLPLDRLLPSLSVLGDVRGRTILATHEEGFGDTLHFMRYLPLLHDLGARIVVRVPRPLVRLLHGLRGVDAIVSDGDTLPAYDFHCPFFSLPRVFGTTPATIPSQPYLVADPMMTQTWAERLPTDGLRVGLAWAGQARPWEPGFTTLDRRRSAGLRAFAPLASVDGVRLVSLQMGEAAMQAADPPPGMALFDPTAAITDFADTAAIVANLDLVVSVDTAVVHLAGALGKPVFLLDRYDNCWRWLSGRIDSPWYPNLTIFRQSHAGDWSTPMARAAAALEAFARFRGIPAAAAHPSPRPELADAA